MTFSSDAGRVGVNRLLLLQIWTSAAESSVQQLMSLYSVWFVEENMPCESGVTVANAPSGLDVVVVDTEVVFVGVLLPVEAEARLRARSTAALSRGFASIFFAMRCWVSTFG